MKSHINTLEMLEKKFNKSMLNRNDIAELLDVSIGTVTNLVKDNKIPYLKLGTATSTIRFNIVSVAGWINDMNTDMEIK